MNIPPNPDNQIEATVVQEHIKLPRMLPYFLRSVGIIDNLSRACKGHRSCSKSMKVMNLVILYIFICTSLQRFTHADRNAATVPHTAIIVASPRVRPSKKVHFPLIAILAPMGPITHIMNAENDPKNAIKALKSGTLIDTPTASSVITTLWMLPRSRFRERRAPCGVVSLFATSSWEVGRTSIPSKIDIVAFSW